MQQYTNKVRGEEDRKLLKMNVNNVAFEILTANVLLGWKCIQHLC